MGKLPDKNVKTNSYVLLGIDVAVIIISVFLPCLIGNSFEPAHDHRWEIAIPRVGVFLSITIGSLWLNGVYDRNWQRALDALVRIAKSILLASILLALLFTFAPWIKIPVSVLFMTVSLLTTLIVITHYCFRAYYVKTYAPKPEPEETECVAKVYSFHEILEKTNKRKHTVNTYENNDVYHGLTRGQ